jgi:hypothetical protein
MYMNARRKCVAWVRMHTLVHQAWQSRHSHCVSGKKQSEYDTEKPKLPWANPACHIQQATYFRNLRLFHLRHPHSILPAGIMRKIVLSLEAHGNKAAPTARVGGEEKDATIGQGV